MPDLSRTKNPDFFEFMKSACLVVFKRVESRLKANADDFEFTPDDVTVHWFRKLPNNDSWEIHMTTTLPDSIYYVVRQDGKTKTTTLDIYHKFESKVIPDEEMN